MIVFIVMILYTYLMIRVLVGKQTLFYTYSFGYIL